MGSKWQVCPTCSQPCQYKDGILCRAFICAKKTSGSNQQAANGSPFDSLFGAMGIKPGDPTYESLKGGFYGKST